MIRAMWRAFLCEWMFLAHWIRNPSHLTCVDVYEGVRFKGKICQICERVWR